MITNVSRVEDGPALTWAKIIESSLADLPCEELFGDIDGQRPENETASLAPDGTARLTNIVNLPAFQPLEFRPNEFFAAVQEWDGVVTSTDEDGFTAQLWDLTTGASEPTDLAEISFDDIDPDDRGKVVEGAIFRWLVGHSRSRSGSTSKKWVFYFRPAVRRRSTIKAAALDLPLEVRQAVRAAIESQG